MERELLTVALPAWDWQVGLEHAEELTVGKASREGTDLLWVWLASGPQCGFASLETIELRGLRVALQMAAATSEYVSCGAFCACTEAA